MSGHIQERHPGTVSGAQQEPIRPNLPSSCTIPRTDASPCTTRRLPREQSDHGMGNKMQKNPQTFPLLLGRIH